MTVLSEAWKRIPCPRGELQLEPILNGGQSFRWKKSQDDTWIGVFGRRVWILAQTDDYLLYRCHKSDLTDGERSTSRKRKSPCSGGGGDGDDEETLLKNYFRMDVDLKEHYRLWSRADPHFKESASRFYGIRMLNQEVVENLFSFICSSNNNITRITSMIDKLCRFYGDAITKVNDESYYSFPDVARLCAPSVESDLRKAGFGYRAKFIHKSACQIEESGGEKWLNKLREMPYVEARKMLMTLPGIGAKVADCICLMSLGHLQAIPVDTHIFQVASNVYLPHLKGCKSVTDKVYNEISSFFQNLYGGKAGWAHTVLFCSELKAFQKEKKKRKEGGRK